MNDLWWKIKEAGRLIKRTMSQLVDQIPAAAGGLNYDDDPRFFGKGDTDYRLNVIPSSLGDTYVLTNVKGTTQKTHSFSHVYDYSSVADADFTGAVYTTLDSCYDVKRNAVYFFIYSDQANHCIIRYNIDDDDFDRIVWDNANIGLDLDYPDLSPFMVDDWLFWNPGSSSPRAVNVRWAYWDYVVLRNSSGQAHAVGDYVADNYSGVWRCIQARTADATAPWTHPDYYVWEDWCYNDCIYKNTNGVSNDSPAYPHTHRYFYAGVKNTIPVPTAVLSNDTSYKSNHIRGHVFQFAVRQYTPELGYTSASPFTPTVVGFEGESYNGEFVGDITTNNKITIRVSLDTLISDFRDYDFLFDHIEILVREGPMDYWRSVRKVQQPVIRDAAYTDSNTDYYEFDFYNSARYDIVDSASVDKPYNYLPITAKAQCALDGQRVAYAGCVESRDPIMPDVALSYDRVEVDYDTAVIDNTDNVTAEATLTTEGGSPTITETVTQYGVNTYYSYTSASNISSTGAAAGEALVATVNGVKYYYTLLDADDDDATAYTDAIVRLLQQTGQYAARISGPKFEYGSGQRNSVIIERFAAGSVTASTPSRKIASFKTGAWHDFCLFYWDAQGRRSPAVALDPVYVPFLAELNPTVLVGTGHYFRIDYDIDHDAPSWAELWGFGYAGNRSVSEFWQYTVAAAGTDSTSGSLYENLSYFDISPLQTMRTDGSLTHQYLNSDIDAYDFEKGDRVRILTAKDTGATSQSALDVDEWYDVADSGTADGPTADKLVHSGQNFLTTVEVGMIVHNTTDNTTTTVTAVDSDTTLSLDDDIMISGEAYEILTPNEHDYEILYYDPTTHYIYFNSDGDIGDSGDTYDYDDHSVVIEIYRPKKVSDNLVYKEIGGRFPVSSGTHTNADDYLYGGDVALITRVTSNHPFATSYPLFMESYKYSDFYDSYVWMGGKAGAVVPFTGETLNIVRYSNKYSKNTLSSGLGVFDGLDYLTLSYNYGDIAAIRQVGGVLKVLFENNVASVLVNRTQFFDADGQSQVVKSDNVLGSVNYSEEAYGCVNPESVLVVDRNLYFFDLRRKCYVRHAPNGMFPISDYKMKKYFIDKADALLTSGESYVKVRSAHDNEHGLVLVGFEDEYTQANNEVIAFHEPSNRWVSFIEYDYDKSIYNACLFVDDADTDTDGPDMAIDVTEGATTQSLVLEILAGESGSWSYPVTLQTTSSVNLYAGDTVTAEIETTGDDWKDALYVTLDFSTGGPTDTSIGTGVGHDATASVGVTAACTMTAKLMVVNDSASAAETVTITLTITVTRNIVPVMLGTPAELLAFTGEDVWILNDSSTYCNLFGDQKTYTVRVYSTENPSIIKQFDSIAIHTNKPFDVSDIQIPVSPNYDNGMQSRIKEARFEKEEGVYRSNYLCNMKTTSATANVKDLFTGDTLRGYYIYHDLDGDETVKHTLYKVDVLSTPSKY